MDLDADQVLKELNGDHPRKWGPRSMPTISAVAKRPLLVDFDAYKKKLYQMGLR